MFRNLEEFVNTLSFMCDMTSWILCMINVLDLTANFLCLLLIIYMKFVKLFHYITQFTSPIYYKEFLFVL
jgi:hypothetical protein